MAGSSLFGGFQNLPSSDLHSSEERQLVHLLREIDKTVSREHAKVIDELAEARLRIDGQEMEIRRLQALLQPQNKNELPVRYSQTPAQYEAKIAEHHQEIQRLKDENRSLKMQIQPSHKRVLTKSETEASHKQVFFKEDKLNKKIASLEQQVHDLESQLETKNHDMLNIIRLFQEILSAMQTMKRLVDNEHTDVSQQGSELHQDIEHLIETALSENKKFVAGLEKRTASELFLKIDKYVKKKYFS